MNANQSSGITLLKIFNYIGGALIFFGVGFFVIDNWFNLNNFVRVFATLGTAVAAFLMAMLLHFSGKKSASSAFFILSGLLLPIGLYVTFYLYLHHIDFMKVNIIVSAICLAVFLISHLCLPRTIFILFTVIFSSFFFVFFIHFLTRDISITHLMEYELITLGFSYFSLGYYLD